ncbi:MAG: DUF1211 domain-containing protein [Proteobacteria bacterium]|nr:DUF1211 domain-containing protein [Pseudomonadota bacterium]
MGDTSERSLKLTLSTSRIEALTDGVFAIAMTLLVLNFDITEPRDAISHERLWGALRSLWPHFNHYVQSFIILAVFWTKNHQQFHFIRRSDRGLLWINMGGLLFVCLIPFSTSLMGDYGNVRIAALIFEANMLAAGLIYWFHWRYATKGHRLVDREIDPAIVRAYNRYTLVVPTIAAIALMLSFFHPRWGTNIFFLTPLVMAYIRR